MLNKLGIEKLSKYHFYKNQMKVFNKYINDINAEFGSLENLPFQVQYGIKREKAKLERYAKENCIDEISEEIFSIN